MSDNKPYNSFLGRGWSFPPQFSKDTQGIKMSTDDEDVREALFVLLSTLPGERLMNPEYGCDLHGQVFNVINNASKTIIKDIINTAILYFEPRVIVENIEIDDSNQMEGRVDVLLTYTVKGINSRKNMVYPFYLAEGTEL